MRPSHDDVLRLAVADHALPLGDVSDDFDSATEFRPLLDLIGDSRLVLVGEASHGTHEFYSLRAQLTKHLILEHGFSAVAVEADWPDAYRINRYVRGIGHDPDAVESLAGFQRFPAWMWRNAEVLDFVGWLRAHNDALEPEARAGFYGLDLYSLHASIAAVLAYLDRVDPEAAQRARDRYGCFEQFGDEPQAYGYAAAIELQPDCEREAVRQLVELQRRRGELLRHDGPAAEDQLFEAEWNARVVSSAERYYRSMFRRRVSSWNLRDTHMADTLDALALQLGRRRRDAAKIVIWAHNSHVGDARATQMHADRELNLGQLMRERHPDAGVLIGLTTYSGSVTAASEWGAAAERKRVRDALPESYEALFHRSGVPNFVLPLRDLGEAGRGLEEPRLGRAIGVIYRPETERASHYLQTCLPRQFDAIVHVDRTRALEPLERSPQWQRGEAPETFPSGL